MQDNNGDKQCCQGANCCDTGKPPHGPDNRSLILRILISVGVLLIAGGITAYVLLTRYPEQAGTPVSGTTQIPPATTRSAISDLNWVKKIYASPTCARYTFALLPGEDKEKNAAVADKVTSLVQQLDKSDVKVSFLTLDRGDPEFAATVEKLLISQTPAIIGLNCSGNIAIIKGNITFEKLYETYIISSAATCNPASGGNCSGCN